MVIREYEGRTERDAIKKASEDLGVESNKLKVEVISEKSKFFSFGNVVKIRVYLDEIEEECTRRAKDFLTRLFNIIGVEVSVRTFEEANKLYIEIVSDNAGLIIGKRGKTLEALQMLTNIVANKDVDNWKKVILDIENYRDRRENALKELALKIALKVKRTGRSHFLEPMNPFERRIIHMTLQSDPSVDTRSEGNGNLKKVKIFLRRRRDRRVETGIHSR